MWTDLFKGGQGSGNRGHGGRPGKRGGSSPRTAKDPNEGKFLKRLPPEQRVWQKKREEGRSPQNQDERVIFGEKGERVAAKALSELLKADVRSMNFKAGENNPIDLVGGGFAVEVKAGKTTNTPGARQWRVTAGEPSLREKLAMRTMSADQKQRLNFERLRYLLSRKKNMILELDRESGQDHEGVTVGLIFSADEKRADLFLIPDFHLRLGWGTYATDQYYLGTVNVSD